MEPPGAGHGPGGGLGGRVNVPLGDPDRVGSGAYGTQIREGLRGPREGIPYGGFVLIPLVGGSGAGGATGSPGRGGGGGGGALLLASTTRIEITGAINANGGLGASDSFGLAGGSGGAIRLVAPVIAGDGLLRTASGNRGDDLFGGFGRIRLDLLDRSDLGDLAVQGIASRGSFMVVFPDAAPRLDIVHAAGRDIPEGTGDRVSVLLPPGSPTTHQVTVQARGFTGAVDLQVVVVPDNGEPVRFPAQIDMSAGEPATVDVEVEILVNTINHVFAWVL